MKNLKNDSKMKEKDSLYPHESLKKKEFSVLDHGFIRVIDLMGDDAAVVQAARVSYGAGTIRVSDDRGLIRYLMRHHHTTPFEMCEIKLHVKVPMDTWRQWIRHRTANVNEYSTRYSEAIEDVHSTDSDEWRIQSKTNRQGSGGLVDPQIGTDLSAQEIELHKAAKAEYHRRLELGVAREQARKDLPLSTYTEAYWKIDLHNLLHFLALRMDERAQLEFRQYANIIGYEIVAKWVPLVWEAFMDYRLNAMTLSGFEVEVVKLLAVDDLDGAKTLLMSNNLIAAKKQGFDFTNEGREFLDKIGRLGYRMKVESIVRLQNHM